MVDLSFQAHIEASTEYLPLSSGSESKYGCIRTGAATCPSLLCCPHLSASRGLICSHFEVSSITWRSRSPLSSCNCRICHRLAENVVRSTKQGRRTKITRCFEAHNLIDCAVKDEATQSQKKSAQQNIDMFTRESRNSTVSIGDAY